MYHFTSVTGAKEIYLLPCFCMHHSLQFDMQHDHSLKYLNVALCPTPYVYPGDLTQVYILKSHLICFLQSVPLSTCKFSVNY